METTTKPKTDVYQMVTDRIIAELENGFIPWKKPWRMADLPRNLVTMKPYRGINLWLLLSLNYDRNYFLSYREVMRLGGYVREGEKGVQVVFWKRLERENEETKEKKVSYLLRYFTIFNIAQCEGIPNHKIPANVNYLPNDPIQTCEEIVTFMPQKPTITHNENRAYYSPLGDYVNMPKLGSFVNSESYYGALFHELIHSTGHKNRLNRKEVATANKFGSELYSQEELVAEIGACYLNSVAGITTEDQFSNNVAYLQNWLEVLKNDKRFIIHASGKAQQATDFILNHQAEPFEMPKEKEYEPAHD